MHRVLALAFALAALAAASPSMSATGGPPYKLDAKGKCHDSSGKFAKQTLCATPAATPPKHCKDPETHKFIKCGTPGAVPA